MTALAGCGRVGFAERAPDARPCELGPWDDIRPIPELAGGSITFGGQIMPDGLTLYFDSNRTSNEELFVAHRTDRVSQFDPPVRLAELGTDAFEANPALTGDELELVFDRVPQGGPQMLRTTRASTAAPWDPPQPLAIPQGFGGPALSIDGLTLVYNSSLDVITEGELYLTTRAQRSDPFVPGARIAALQGMPYRGFAALSPDGLLLLYEAETGASGALELWQTTRAALDDAFGPPTRIDELAAGGDASDPSITADGRELFFASSRGTGGPQLYVASRDCR